MKTKRVKVGSKYLRTFVDHDGKVCFTKSNGKVAVWSKKELSYLEKVMKLWGETVY